jgi:hypothetical protein
MSQTRRLDWIPNPDPRNGLYRVAAFDCFAQGAHRASIMRRKSVWLDQGQEGACTGFGEEDVRALSPRAVASVSDDTARRVYVEAKKRDEWPGEDYDGSSVNGAMKAARAFGFIKSWHWCMSLDEVKHALSYHGAIEIGVNWYSGMWEPDANGLLHADGSQVGGHAIAVAGYKPTPGGIVYRLENSWGRDWGDNGGAWLSEFDLERLRMEDGEFALPVKVAA